MIKAIKALQGSNQTIVFVYDEAELKIFKQLNPTIYYITSIQGRMFTYENATHTHAVEWNEELFGPIPHYTDYIKQSNDESISEPTDTKPKKVRKSRKASKGEQV